MVEIFESRIREKLNYNGVKKALLVMGDCRSGTTASMNFLRILLGWPTFYQPGKSTDRMLKGGKYPPKYNLGEHGSSIIIKETIGPYNTECFFNPVQTHMLDHVDGRGLDPRALKVIANIRNPYDTFLSWQRTFHQFSLGEDPLTNFIAAHKTFTNAITMAKERGSQVVIFPQEFLFSPEENPNHIPEIIQSVLSTVGLEVDGDRIRAAMSNWEQIDEKRLREQFHIPNVLGLDVGALLSSFNRGGYSYSGTAYSEARDQLEADQIDTINSSGLSDDYNNLMREAGQQLGVTEYSHLLIY